MTLDRDDVVAAAQAVASVPGVQADARSVLEDAFLLSLAFSDAEEYRCAVANTCRALRHLVMREVSPSQLKYAHAGWSCYHYQHKVAQGQRADMRIVFMETHDGVRLRAFGHRNMPKDFYERLSGSR